MTVVTDVTVEFDPVKHEYWGEGGRRLPGVTEVIAGLGLIDKRWFTKKARDRGAAVHAALHFYLEKDLNWDSLDPRISGYVASAIKFLEFADFKLEEPGDGIEVRVYDRHGLYAGTADYIGTAFGARSVIDWKTGAVGNATGLQTAAYDMAAGGPSRRRIGVALNEDGSLPHKVDFRNQDDYRLFAASVALYRRFVFKEEFRVADC